jgi:hypothetical protein
MDPKKTNGAEKVMVQIKRYTNEVLLLTNREYGMI